MSDASDRWILLQTHFEAALEVPTAERGAWLEQEIADPELRADVSRLVAAHGRPGPFDTLAGALATFGAGDASGEAVPAEIGPYRIEDLLGEGGTARVFAARPSGDSPAARVAIKVLRADADSTRVRRRFLAEREIVAGLSHPGIARFVDAGFTTDGAPYLVTEYVDGRPIDRYVEEEGLGVDARIRLFLEVCDAVEAAHRMGVVHRDLKPGNVLVDAAGHPRLLDFGIAKVLDGAVFPELRRNTSAGVRVLTFRYASPEQLVGAEITPASDVYQLGLLLHRLLTGRLPAAKTKFEADDSAPPPRLSAMASEPVPRGLDPVVAQALEPRAPRRHGSAGGLAAAVRASLQESAASGRGVRARLRAWLGRTRPG